MKKKRAGIELESLGVSVGVCMVFFFLGEGRCSGDSDKVTLEKTLEEGARTSQEKAAAGRNWKQQEGQVGRSR